MQHLAGPAMVDVARLGPQRVLPFLGLDRRDGDDLPVLLAEHVAEQVVGVQPLHDDHDRAGRLVVQPGVQRVVVELPDPPPLGFRQGVERLDRVVDHDQVGAPAEHRAADRGGEARALGGGDQLDVAVAPRLDPEPGEDLAVPLALDHGAEIERVLAGQVMGVADRHHLEPGIVAEPPGGEGDGDADRLQVARRDVDDQAPALAVGDPVEVVGDVPDVPVLAVAGAGLQGGQALGDEAGQVLAQQGVEQATAVTHHSLPGGGTPRGWRRPPVPRPSHSLPDWQPRAGRLCPGSAPGRACRRRRPCRSPP